MATLQWFITRSKELEKEIRDLQTFIDSAPPGNLIARKKEKGRTEFYQSFTLSPGRRKEIYIPDDNRTLAADIARKEYSRKMLNDCILEKKALDKYLSAITAEKTADIYLKQHPEAAKLINAASANDFISNWKNTPYIRSNEHPENLIYPTVIPDLKVRSKAEGDIISRLIHYRIPFRYEETLIINGVVLHPDFTCLNIRTLKEYYWEHQGGWDQERYVGRLGSRESQLLQAGIIPWKNLIITTETGDEPLDINWVDMIIQHFLM